MTELNRELEITYLHSGDDTFKLSIPDYDTAKSNTEIYTAVDAILEQAAFEPNGFTLTSVEKVAKRTTNEEILERE